LRFSSFQVQGLGARSDTMGGVSLTCKSLSLAKLTQKSHAITS
jgi:hypothetical protein